MSNQTHEGKPVPETGADQHRDPGAHSQESDFYEEFEIEFVKVESDPRELRH